MNRDKSHVFIVSLKEWRERGERGGRFKVDLEASVDAMQTAMGYEHAWDILILERL